MANRFPFAVVAFALVPLALLAAGCQSPFSSVMTYGDRYRSQGIQRYNAGDYLEAEGAFDEAVSQNPGDFRNHYWLGKAQLENGEPQQAVQSFDTALRVRPMSSQGRKDLEARDDLAAAMGQAIAASPDGSAELSDLRFYAQSTQDPAAWLAVANAHRAAGDADNAIRAYDTALSLKPDDGRMSKQYALYLMELQQYGMAEPVLINAYDADPRDEEVIAALRELNIVPGPSLRPRDRLARPGLPKGPIPELRINAGFDDNRGNPVDLDAVRERYDEDAQ